MSCYGVGGSAQSENVPFNRNLIKPDNLIIRCEDGISASYKPDNDRGIFLIKSAPSTKTPSIYLATVEVKANTEYTYFLKGLTELPSRVILYVTTENANLVWPGDELQDGFAHSSFKTPQDATHITLAATFLHPTERQSFTLQDIGLFKGNLSEWPEGNLPQDYAPLFGHSRTLQSWLLGLSFIVIAFIILIDSRLRKKSDNMKNLSAGR